MGTGQNRPTTCDLLVCSNFENLTQFKVISADEIELEAVTQAILKHSHGKMEYWIGDRKMKYLD